MVFRNVDELDAIIGQDDLNLVWNSGYQRIEEGSRRGRGGLVGELDGGERRRAVDPTVQIQLAFRRLDRKRRAGDRRADEAEFRLETDLHGDRGGWSRR